MRWIIFALARTCSSESHARSNASFMLDDDPFIGNPPAIISFSPRVAGAQPLIANRTAIGTWEKLDLITH